MSKKEKKKLIIIILAVVFVLGLFFVGSFLYKQIKKTENQNQKQVEAIINNDFSECEKRKSINGLCYDLDSEPGLFSVMIENHSDSRPPSGLSGADLIYESVVEAPITRFLAVFSLDNKINKIGPVRSARPFYVDWAKEFKAPYLHVGGSPEALDYLAESYVFDLNQFSFGQYFWRDSSRHKPHNVYTSTDLVKKAIASQSWSIKNDFNSWKYKPEGQIVDEAKTAKEVYINFNSPVYAVKWLYDEKRNNYQRFQAGRPHKDADYTQIYAKNIAIMYTESRIIDSYGRRETKTVGQGKALIFQDGKVLPAEWRRPGLDQRTRFFSTQDQEVKFNPGTTWIEVIPVQYPEVKYE